MINHPLDFNTRKALCAHLGSKAGSEIADLLLSMCRQIEVLERSKSDASIGMERNAGYAECSDGAQHADGADRNCRTL